VYARYQVTLSTTSRSHDSAAGAILQFKYVLTLTEAALSCALITTNVGNNPVSIHGSFPTSIAVSFVDGAYAIGLQGYKYRPGPPNPTPGPHDEMVVEEEDMVRMKGGFDRHYTEIQDSVSLLDRVSTNHLRSVFGFRISAVRFRCSKTLRIGLNQQLILLYPRNLSKRSS